MNPTTFESLAVWLAVATCARASRAAESGVGKTRAETGFGVKAPCWSSALPRQPAW